MIDPNEFIRWMTSVTPRFLKSPPDRDIHPPWSPREAASVRSSLLPQWYESSSGELRQIGTIKRLIWDAPALCVAPTRTARRGWRECAPRNNTTGQCKHRRGKPTMRLDPERPPPGLLRAPGLHRPPRRRGACARACALIGPGGLGPIVTAHTLLKLH